MYHRLGYLRLQLQKGPVPKGIDVIPARHEGACIQQSPSALNEAAGAQPNARVGGAEHRHVDVQAGHRVLTAHSPLGPRINFSVNPKQRPVLGTTSRGFCYSRYPRRKLGLIVTRVLRVVFCVSGPPNNRV